MRLLRNILTLYREAFEGLPREVWLLSAVVLVNRAGTMVMPFLTIYLSRRLGMGAGAIGALMSLFGAGAFVGSYLGGWLCSRVSARAIQAVTLFLNALVLFVLMELSSWPQLAAGLFFLGLFAEGFRPANSTALADACAAAQRPRAFALNRMAINIGMTIGPTLGGFLAEWNYRYLFVVDGVTCLTAVGFLLVALPKKAAPTVSGSAESASGLSASVWRDKVFWVFILLMFPLELIFLQLFSTFPLYLRDAYGLTESRIGILFAVNTFQILLFEMLLVKRLETLPMLRVMAWGTVCISLGLGGIVGGTSFVFAVLAMVVFTLGEMLLVPVSGAFVANRAGDGNRGTYMGIYSASFGLAFVFAPLIGMAVYEKNPQWLWYAILGMGAILTPAIWLLRKQEEKSALVEEATQLN